jgi:peptidoglycan hydrolase-like protein with peptidoglycan-binding domain
LSVLAVGPSGPEVTALQQKLKDKGFDPGLIDGNFVLGTEAAVIAFQKSEGLEPDGIVGLCTQAALNLDEPPAPGAPPAPIVTGAVDIIGAVTVAEVSRMCLGAPLGNIKANLPPILEALRALGLGDKPMVLMAIATIRAETAGFEPISEFKSRFNTSPRGHPFDLYDSRKDLGNCGAPDGTNFKGRGFVQLTGRFNYEKLDRELGLGGRLVSTPDLANDPTIAAKILARFLKNVEAPSRAALQQGNLKRARKLVNGGTHGFLAFKEAFDTGNRLIA